MTEGTSQSPQEVPVDETLVLLNHAEVAALIRLLPAAFSNLLAQGGFPVKPAMRRGRKKFWRLSDIRQYLTP